MGSDTTTGKAEHEAPLSLWGKVLRELKEWAVTLAVFIPLFFLFSMIFYEQRVIPSESMVPNLRVGDRVAVSKFSYGYGRYSIPWGIGRWLPLGDGRIFASDPERGDVAVFMHPHFNRVMIKRVIGLPGDRVVFRGEQMYLNGEAVQTDFVRTIRYVAHDPRGPRLSSEYRETFGDRSWLIHQYDDRGRLDNTFEFVVPEGHLLFIGDNRDNSTDGRETTGHCSPVNGVIDRAGCPLDPRIDAERASIGFVPMDHLIGRADTVILSFYRCRQEAGTECLSGRLWQGL
ncbi:MAG: signal peptidase I [Pseudomonadota bacterium]